MLLASCGGDPATINGDWSATLSGTQTLKFTVTLNQTTPPELDVTDFNFTTPTACFDSLHGQSGSFAPSGNIGGNITGAFNLSISTLFPAQPQNVLSLQGEVNGNTITGSWSLTGGVGQGCSPDSGNFTMHKI